MRCLFSSPGLRQQRGMQRLKPRVTLQLSFVVLQNVVAWTPKYVRHAPVPSRGCTPRYCGTETEPPAVDAPFRELRFLSTPGSDSSALSDFLLDLGALSVQIEDAYANTENETPLFDDPDAGVPPLPSDQLDIFRFSDVHNRIWNTCQVTALFPSTWDTEVVVNSVAEVFQMESRPIVETSSLEDRDWLAEIQRSWKPLCIGDVVVRFPWHNDADVLEIGLPLEAEGSCIRHVELEGGAAFGTGEHATTRMCCEWIQHAVRRYPERTVKAIDYGAGSGLLGIVALRMGAMSALGVEIDRDAISSCHANAKMNGVDFRCYLPANSAVDQGGADHSDSETAAIVENKFKARFNEDVGHLPLEKTDFDILIANILARPLLGLAAEFARLCKPGADLALSGILEEQAADVIKSYEPFFNELQVAKADRGWVLITGKRAPSEGLEADTHE